MSGDHRWEPVLDDEGAETGWRCGDCGAVPLPWPCPGPTPGGVS